MVGRMCLAVTITLAFPMLVIPGRDIVVRSVLLPRMKPQQTTATTTTTITAEGINTEDELAEPLLENQHQDEEMMLPNNQDDGYDSSNHNISFGVLLSISVVIFWSAAALASLVSSIDVVWDLLGSSLSIIMSYIIPAGTYLAITNKNNENESNNNTASRIACWVLLGGSVPLMVVSTANAMYNTFFKD